MTVREFVFQLLTTDDELNNLGLTADSTFTTHTIDTPQVRPLCILRWLETVPGITSTQVTSSLKNFPINHRVLQVWVHDDKNVGDYARIDAALKRVRTLLTSVEGVNVGETDSWLSGINWEGDSDDLRDDDTGTITRNTQYRLTGSAI